VDQPEKPAPERRADDPEKPVPRAFLVGAGMFLPAVIVLAIALVVVLFIVL
jgi:hypothetical protein